MIFNEDFVEFIEVLNKNKVDYILVGGYSVIVHGYSRTTGDMDIWVNPTKSNFLKLKISFSEFGLPIEDLNEFNFLHNKEIDVFSYGRPPVSIDIMKEVKGLNFEEVFDSSFFYKINDEVEVRVIHINHLRQAKKASNRPKDRDDLNNLKSD